MQSELQRGAAGVSLRAPKLREIRARPRLYSDCGRLALEAGRLRGNKCIEAFPIHEPGASDLVTLHFAGGQEFVEFRAANTAISNGGGDFEPAGQGCGIGDRGGFCRGGGGLFFGGKHGL